MHLRHLLAVSLLAPALAAQDPVTVYTFAGSGAGELLGSAVAGAGDVDGDGFDDVLVGASEASSGGAGTALLYSGLDGSLLDSWSGDAVFDEFGTSVATADVDGDGTPDLVVGAVQGRIGVGYVRVFDGADGSVLHTFTGDAPFDRLGLSVAGVGDLNGDGFEDVAAGAEELSTGEGYVRVWSGEWITKTAAAMVPVTSEVLHQFDGDDFDDRFGTSVAGAGDVDDDGTPDLVIGAPFDDDGGNNAGRARVYSGATFGVLHTFTGAAAFDTLGVSVASAGDVDGDGRVDLVLGADQFGNGGGDGPGYARVVSGASGATLWTLTGTSVVPSMDDRFGRSVAAAGDVDGDSLADVLVGAPGNDGAAPDAGRVFIFSGQDARIIGSSSGSAADRLGRAVASVEDVNGDGVPDFVAGGAGGPSGDGVTKVLAGVSVSVDPAPSPFIGSLTGRVGRPALVTQTGLSLGPDIEFDVPVIVNTKVDDALVNVQAVDTVEGDQVIVMDLGDKETGSLGGTNPDPQPVMAAQGFVVDTGSGVEDVITANKNDDSFSFLQANTDPFDPEIFFDAVVFALNTDTEPVVARIGDLVPGGSVGLDVALAGATGVEVHDGDNTGGFVFVDFEAVPDPSSPSTDSLHTDMILADLDGQPGTDVFTTSGGVASGGQETGWASVLLNDGAGNLGLANQLPIGQAVASVAPGDFDDDGDVDVVLAIHQFDAGPSGEPQGALQLYTNAGTGTFTLAGGAFIDGPDVGTLPDNLFPSADGLHPTFPAVGDVDNDTFLDVVYTSSDSFAYPPGTFADEQPPVEITVLLNDRGGVPGQFSVFVQGTPFSGKGVTPVLKDVAPEPLDGVLDLVLVWTDDGTAGLEGTSTSGVGETTHVAVLVGDGEGGFFSAAPNQFLTDGDDPGDGDAGHVDSGTDGGPATTDVVIPNQRSNSLRVFLGDGQGGFVPPPPPPNPNPFLTPGIDDVTVMAAQAFFGPGTVPEGGPRVARLGHMDGDAARDVVVYNFWEDITDSNPDVLASLSFLLGDGSGGMTKVQYLPLDGGGEFELGDVVGPGAGQGPDGQLDVVVTQRVSVTDSIEIYTGLGDGTVDVTPTVLAPPAGHLLTGGLLVVDLDGDTDPDLVTTTVDPGGPTFHLAVYENLGDKTFALVPSQVDGPWSAVRTLEFGDLTGDGVEDALIAARGGRLMAARRTGLFFTPQSTSLNASKRGGGAIRLANLNGDKNPDVVSSNHNDVDGVQDQAVVRTLRGGVGLAFELRPLNGLAAVSRRRALRPLVADMNDDGTDDIILSHGTARTMSVLLNNLSAFENAPATPGTPSLRGRGYSTPGGEVTLTLSGATGGASAVLLASTPGMDAQSLLDPAWTAPLGVMEVFVVDGPPGVAGLGTKTLTSLLPGDPALVDLVIDWKVLFVGQTTGGGGGGTSGGGGGGGSASGGSSGLSGSGRMMKPGGGVESSTTVRMTIVD